MAKKLKCEIRISKRDWDSTHKDYKSIIKGQKYKVMMTDKGTSLVPICIKRKKK